MNARNLLVLALLLPAVAAVAYAPQAQHFATSDLWNLWCAWSENGGMYSTQPASLTATSIDMTWKSRYLRTAQVRLEVEDGLVVRLRERLPLPQDPALEPIAAPAERVWFALQARSPQAVAPLLEAGVQIRFAGQQGMAAVDSLLARFPQGRLLLLRLDATLGASEARLRLLLPADATLELTIPADEPTLKHLRMATARNVPAPQPVPAPEAPVPYDRQVSIEPAAEAATPAVPPRPNEPYTPAAPARPFRPLGSEVQSIVRGSKDLGEFVARTWDRSLSRELLQNKVTSVEEFLRGEMPHHSMERDGEAWVLRRPASDNLGATLRLRKVPLRDGIDIVADDAYTLRDNALLLPDGERIDLQALSPEEAALLAPHFVQLLYLHRALGTRLLDFLLLPDVVATTLVVKGEQRELYEPRNYFQSLLMLSRWWQGRTVYFGIRDVKKVNSHVEFRGYLLAQDDHGRADYAEIRFHLSNDYRLDLAIMFLYPDIETTPKD